MFFNKTSKDTHAWKKARSNESHSNLNIDGTHYSEALKLSNLHHVTITNFNLIGGSEDSIDVVRGSDYIFSDGIINLKDSQQGITIKGGAENVILKNIEFIGKPKLGFIVLGQYSDYDFCRNLPTKNIFISNCKFPPNNRPSLITWNVKNIKTENNENFSCIQIPKLLVCIYFSFRKIQQRILHGKFGRNSVCNKI